MFVLHAADIPEEEARYWAKKLEQLNAMRDQDVSSLSLQPLIHVYLFICSIFKATACSTSYPALLLPYAQFIF